MTTTVKSGPTLTADVLTQARRQREQERRAQFTTPRCARCDRTLADRHGNPSWEILEGQFVCYEACCGPLPIRR